MSFRQGSDLMENDVENQSKRADVVADLARRAKIIADGLAAAFGGPIHNPAILGLAVASQIINNGLTVHGTVEELVAAVFAAMDEDYQEGDDKLFLAVAAAKVRDLVANHESLPFPLADPTKKVGPIDRNGDVTAVTVTVGRMDDRQSFWSVVPGEHDKLTQVICDKNRRLPQGRMAADATFLRQTGFTVEE